MGIRVYRDRNGKRDFVGRIDYHANETASFAYDSNYLDRAIPAGELGLSELLPLDDQPYSAEEFGPFFRGLLPEGEVYGNLAEYYQVLRSDYLTLLEQMGCESIGALTFISESVDPSEYEPFYSPVTSETMSHMKSNPARMATFTASETRLSLAGAQSKVAWFLPQGIDAEEASCNEWFIPRGSAPSTHIIKISRKGEEDIAANELGCSLIAAACNIETASVSELSDVPGAIAVKRYDRKWSEDSSDKLIRLHQEDFCQALGFSPFLKYQPESVSANYPAMMSDLVERTCADPLLDKTELAKRLVFSYLIGNTDAHLKNFSLLYNQRWSARSLSPLYDVTCIPLTGYSTKMPFDMGDHRFIEDITAQDIMLVAADLNVSLHDFDLMVKNLVKTFEAPVLPTLTKFSPSVKTMVDRILDNSIPRIKTLKKFTEA